MKVIYAPGCDDAWRARLTPWQLSELAALHRQGRHLRDGTDHDQDARWRQRGVRTRQHPLGWRRTSRRDRHGHERVLIAPTDYGFEERGIRRETIMLIDAETGVASTVEGWVTAWAWYVSADRSANYPPKEVAA